MTLNINRVAIIGAGVSGVVAGKHLKASGIDITIYERSSGYGGVWVYDERLPLEPTYPSAKPSVADFDSTKIEGQAAPSEIVNGSKVQRPSINELQYAPPGPCYESLRNNVPTPLVKLQGQSWPEGTTDFVLHSVLKDYIIEAARRSNLKQSTRFSTRVERVWKDSKSWKVASRTLRRSKSGQLSSYVDILEYDGIVVASGHYHAIRVPDIPGLAAWRSKWPDRVAHSKSYRRPSNYKNQNVFLIGAGTSSTDIARELVGLANNIYQSSRGGSFDLPVELLPGEALRVSGISYLSEPSRNSTRLDHDQPIPGDIHLQDGTILRNIHRITVCTGYNISLPFLSQFHADDTKPDLASAETIVTDGNQYHNLHEDIFYIPDPTLAFIGVPYYTATFSLFEYQARVLAVVWSGGADLPSRTTMTAVYNERVQTIGYGRGFNSLKGKEVEYVNRLLDWVNAYSAQRCRARIESYDEEWLKGRAILAEKIKERFARGYAV